jgi:hypothetical protein
MTASTNKTSWDVLKDFGFVPDDSVMSDIMPGLSFDFGGFELSASAVMGNSLHPVVLFTGVFATPRTIAEVCFEIPREGLPAELVAAWIVWNLDRVAPERRFTPNREVTWLETGRQNQHRLPWEVSRAERAAEAAAYAVRPHCRVNRSVLRLAFKTLAGTFTQVLGTDFVIVSFDGRILSFLCGGVETVLGATGGAWPCRYRVRVESLRENLPKRLRAPVVEVGIWKSTLEIDRCRYRGVEEIT